MSGTENGKKTIEKHVRKEHHLLLVCLWPEANTVAVNYDGHSPCFPLWERGRNTACSSPHLPTKLLKDNKKAVF
jgi:hypothetical protein